MLIQLRIEPTRDSGFDLVGAQDGRRFIQESHEKLDDAAVALKALNAAFLSRLPRQ